MPSRPVDHSSAEGPVEPPVRIPAEAPPAHISREMRFPLFDSLRAMAALAVFAFHFVVLVEVGALEPYFRHLNVGVTLFFVISGFLLYRPFVASALDGAPNVRVGPYAWRRFLRITPAYWVALTVVSIWFGYTAVFSADGILYYGFAHIYRGDTLLNGLGQAWTLAVEATFYAFLPLWALFMRRRHARRGRHAVRFELVALAVLAAASLTYKELFVFHASSDVTTAVVTALPAYLDQFAAGMALAVLSVTLGQRPLPGPAQVLERFPGVAWAVAAVAFWIVSTYVHVPYGLDGTLVSAGDALASHVLYAVIAVALLIPAAFGDQRRGVVRRVLANRALLWIGVVSYGLYLWHQAIVLQFQDWDLPSRLEDALPIPAVVTAGMLALAASLVLAALSYYVVETPALRLKRLPPDRSSVLRLATGIGLGGALLVAGIAILGNVPAWTRPVGVVAAVVVAVLATRPSTRSLWPSGPRPGRVLAACGVLLAACALVVLVVSKPGLGALPPEGPQPTHLALSFDGKTSRLWVNGRLRGSSKIPGGRVDAGGALEIGTYLGGTPFRGVIDEIAVYGRALPKATLVEHDRLGRDKAAGARGFYPVVVGLTPGLLAYLRLGEGRGATTVRDETKRTAGTYPERAPEPTRGLIAGDRDGAARFDGGPATISVPVEGLGSLREAFTVELWVEPKLRPGHAAVITSPGAWDLQLDVLSRWGAGVVSGGTDVRMATKKNALMLAIRKPGAKPSPDPALLALLAGVLIFLAGVGRALRPRVDRGGPGGPAPHAGATVPPPDPGATGERARDPAPV